MEETPTYESDFKTLTEHIEYLKQTSDLLGYRLDTIQRLLDQETFDLENYALRVASNSNTNKVKALLEELGLKDSVSLKMGDFLKALNTWLIQKELVDLNDLQIHLNPMLCAAFQKAPGLKKIPYALLLTSLPKMFE
jgi:hypothetical protein